MTRLAGSKRIQSETAPENRDPCFRESVQHLDRALTCFDSLTGWTKRGISSKLAALKHFTHSISRHDNMKSRCALRCRACFRLKSAWPQLTRFPAQGNALQPATHCLCACMPSGSCLKPTTQFKLECHTCPGQKSRLWQHSLKRHWLKYVSGKPL